MKNTPPPFSMCCCHASSELPGQFAVLFALIRIVLSVCLFSFPVLSIPMWLLPHFKDRGTLLLNFKKINWLKSLRIVCGHLAVELYSRQSRRKVKVKVDFMLPWKYYTRRNRPSTCVFTRWTVTTGAKVEVYERGFSADRRSFCNWSCRLIIEIMVGRA